MSDHDADSCPRCRAPITRLDHFCPYCHSQLRHVSGVARVLGMLVGFLLAALILVAVTTGKKGSELFEAVCAMLGN